MNRYIAVWLGLAAALLLIAAVAARIATPPTPQPSDCPAGHVYIDYGETPQAGCWPEGVAQQMGVYPEPEEPNGN